MNQPAEFLLPERPANPELISELTCVTVTCHLFLRLKTKNALSVARVEYLKRLLLQSLLVEGILFKGWGYYINPPHHHQSL